jgi:hypothetical protein
MRPDGTAVRLGWEGEEVYPNGAPAFLQNGQMALPLPLPTPPPEPQPVNEKPNYSYPHSHSYAHNAPTPTHPTAAALAATYIPATPPPDNKPNNKPRHRIRRVPVPKLTPEDEKALAEAKFLPAKPILATMWDTSAPVPPVGTEAHKVHPTHIHTYIPNPAPAPGASAPEARLSHNSHTYVRPLQALRVVGRFLRSSFTFSACMAPA